MRRRLVRTLAALALAGAAAPALAGSPYGGEDSPGQGKGQGSVQGARRGAPAAVPARRGPAGLFNCSFREQRTKLERKNCGTLRP